MKKIFYVILLVAIGFAACRKTPTYDDLSSDFIVSTNLDKTASFSSYKTYYIADTVVNLGGTGADTLLTDANAVKLVASVKNNMSSRGYSLVARNAKPDLVQRMGVVKTVNVEVYYPGWWGAYGGWYPFGGGYYPYYYPWTTVYTYNTGTVILDTYDVKNAKANGQYKVIWNISSFGALGSDIGANLNRGITSINQGFAQSPYLKAN